ncbi:ribonucleoside-diphosphate reductase [Candidatus Gracilibacteria bacterium]|nr:ribonucleoside-diphosphate reductase [Candidatus Gracilibacteria bacterium]NJS41449.1 ribonucleoside-diphosphate reductase [Candidatus Gracilibacteria bacterium]
MTDQLLTPNPRIYTVFTDNTNSKIVEMCDKQESNIWLSSDINLTHDSSDFEKLNKQERDYIKYILAFFAASDGIVGENLAINFLRETQIPEVRYFYYFQSMMEAVHAKVYSNLITTFIHTEQERNMLFNAVNEHPMIKAKADWAKKHMSPDASFYQKLIAFLAVEGIFFAGSFAAIFWLRDRGIMANSLGVANEYISRDETLHADFACLLYNEFGKGRIDEKEIREIILSALKLEKEFTLDSLPDKLFGMNSDLMCQYLEFVVDTWLTQLGLPKEFNVEQPFSFMTTIGQKRKDNFHEKTRTNYGRQTVSKELDFAALTF